MHSPSASPFQEGLALHPCPTTPPPRVQPRLACDAVSTLCPSPIPQVQRPGMTSLPEAHGPKSLSPRLGPVDAAPSSAPVRDSLEGPRGWGKQRSGSGAQCAGPDNHSGAV